MDAPECGEVTESLRTAAQDFRDCLKGSGEEGELERRLLRK